jgi:hypothetical protein
LPDGEPFQLTKTPFRKQTINFSQDGSRLFFTQLEGQFVWNTYELPLLGAQEPKLFMANATGLSWIDSGRVLFSAITTGIHMKLVTSNPNRTEERDIYVPADPLQGMVHRSALSPDGKKRFAGGDGWRVVETMPGGSIRTAPLVDGQSDPRVLARGPSGLPTGNGCTSLWTPGQTVFTSGANVFLTALLSS